jgi:RimJ/RimL family protein N-acetyltransferase
VNIAFAPLREEDVPLVERWLQEEHVARWWRDPVDETIEKRRAGIQGRRPTRQFVIVVDDRPAGFIQTYRVADHPEWQELVQVGDGVAGVDLMLGEPDLVGRGLGPRVLSAFTRDVVFVDPEIDAVVATVEEPNRRSWRAFENAGFRHVRDVQEDGLPHRLMRLDRSA